MATAKLGNALCLHATSALTPQIFHQFFKIKANLLWSPSFISHPSRFSRRHRPSLPATAFSLNQPPLNFIRGFNMPICLSATLLFRCFNYFCEQIAPETFAKSVYAFFVFAFSAPFVMQRFRKVLAWLSQTTHSPVFRSVPPRFWLQACCRCMSFWVLLTLLTS